MVNARSAEINVHGNFHTRALNEERKPGLETEKKKGRLDPNRLFNLSEHPKILNLSCLGSAQNTHTLS